MSTLRKVKLLISCTLLLLGLAAAIYGMELNSNNIQLTDQITLTSHHPIYLQFYYLGVAMSCLLCGALILMSVKE